MAFRDELGMPYGIVAGQGDPLAFPSPIDPFVAIFPVVDTLVIVPDTYPLGDTPSA